jgi:hypothetical protein
MIISPAYEIVHPSYMMPELLLPYYQASGAFSTLPNQDVMVRLGDGDKAVYIRRADIRTKNALGQAAYNQLPGVNIVMSMIATPTYLLRLRAEYDHHDTSAAGNWGVGIAQAYRLGGRQSMFQLLRTMLLFGTNPVTGEGLLNAPGTTSISLPPDSFGNTTAGTYDNGQMALFLTGQIAALKTRTNQLGIGRTFCILGPQRILGPFEYNIVQVVQFQREGAGTESTAGTVKMVTMKNGDTILWAYDDTLQGAGAGGTDAVLIVMPEVENPHMHDIDTNEFARLTPGLAACTAMLTDMAAPREIPTPLAGGAIDVLSEMRATSGWPIRPESVSIISMAP